MAGLAIGFAFLSSFGLGFAAVVAWLAIVLLLRARGSIGWLGAVVVVAASVSGSAWAFEHRSELGPGLPTGEFDGVVQVVDGPFLTKSGQRFIVRGAAAQGAYLCVYAGPEQRPHVGDTLLLHGKATSPQDLSEIGRAALAAWGCATQIRAEGMSIIAEGTGVRAALSRFRTSLSDSLMQTAPGDTGALLSGLVTGDDGALTRETSDAFLVSGTTHITAISGANFTVLVLLLGVMASGSMKRSFWFIAGATAVIWAYAIMVGLQPSAFRAALLASAVLVGRCVGRVPDLLTLTLLLASLQVLLRPHDFKTLAFQLSIAATVALIVVFDGSMRIGSRSWPESLVLTIVAAQLATLPILAARIEAVSGIGLLANLVIGPLASIAFPLALAGALFGQIAAGLGNEALLPAEGLARLMIWVVSELSAQLPGMVELGAPVPGAIAVLTIVCWTAIFAMSGDLRRMGRHGWSTVREW